MKKNEWSEDFDPKIDNARCAGFADGLRWAADYVYHLQTMHTEVSPEQIRDALREYAKTWEDDDG